MSVHPQAAPNTTGTPGIWLSPEDANRVFFVLGTCIPNLRTVAAKQDAALEAAHALIRTSSAARREEHLLVTQYQDQAVFYKAALEQARGDLKDEREAAASVWRSPVLWLTVGVVLTGLAVGGGYYVAQHIGGAP